MYLLTVYTSDVQSQPRSWRETGGKWKRGAEWATGGQVLRFVPCLAEASLKLSCRQKRDLQPNQDDLRAQFYQHYRKEADDYDKEFMKKYDEDLNTTLIFVRRGRCLVACVLTRVTGRSFFCSNLCVHYLCPAPTPAGPERRGRRSPPCHHPQAG